MSCFFSVPYITHKMGSAEYGALMLLLTYVELFGLLNLGMNTSLVKYLAELLPQGRNDDIENYFGTTLTAFLVAGAIVGCSASLGAGTIVTHFLKVPSSLQSSVVCGFWLASAAFFLKFVAQAPSAVPIAAQRFEITNFLVVGLESARILASVAVLYFGYSLVAVMIVTVVISLLSCIANFIAAQALLPRLSLRPKFSALHLRSLLHFSKFVLIGNLSSRIADSTDNMIIGHFLPVSNMAFYGVSYSLGQKLWSVAGNVAAVVFPAASTLSASSERRQLKELYLRGSKAVALVAFFPALALCILSRPLLLYWLGPEFALHGTTVLRLLSLGFLLNSLGCVPYLVLQGTQFPKIAAGFAAAYALANFVWFVFLIPRFGINGAGSGFLISQLLVIPWMVHAVNHRLGVSWRELLTGSYLPLLLSSAAGFLPIFAWYPSISSLFKLALCGAVGAASYVAAALILVLDDTERSTCFRLVERCLPFARQAEVTGSI